jgi:hypothetical protein
MEGLSEVLLGILGGGGVVGGMATYIVTQHKARIEDLKDTLNKTEARALKAEEGVLLAVQSLPAIEAHLTKRAQEKLGTNE